MQKTESLGLNLPESTEFYDIENQNENMRILDELLGKGTVNGAEKDGNGKVIDETYATLTALTSLSDDVTDNTSDIATKADYEEGTFTPSFYDSSGGTIAMSNAIGYYKKVGKFVYITASGSTTNKTFKKMTGLPFGASNIFYASSGASIQEHTVSNGDMTVVSYKECAIAGTTVWLNSYAGTKTGNTFCVSGTFTTN